MRQNRTVSFMTHTVKGKCLAVPPKQLLLYGQESGPLAGVYLFHKHAVYVQAAAVFECCDKPWVYSKYMSPVISTAHNTPSLQQKT
jgi:molybdopterin-guanine dinucleotide biosynthesis protein A